jgi:DNA-binding PadR family transcriptional regulator
LFREKKLEDHILQIYTVRGMTELRWSHIRNELSTNPEIPEKEWLSEGFSVKLSRALKRLCKEDLLEKHVYGHRDVRYSLTENGKKKLFSKPESAIEMKYKNWGAGCYTPGCRFEDFMKRMEQQWMELFNQEFPKEELRNRYEAIKSRASKHSSGNAS